MWCSPVVDTQAQAHHRHHLHTKTITIQTTLPSWAGRQPLAPAPSLGDPLLASLAFDIHAAAIRAWVALEVKPHLNGIVADVPLGGQSTQDGQGPRDGVQRHQQRAEHGHHT